MTSDEIQIILVMILGIVMALFTGFMWGEHIGKKEVNSHDEDDMVELRENGKFVGTITWGEILECSKQKEPDHTITTKYPAEAYEEDGKTKIRFLKYTK